LRRARSTSSYFDHKSWYDGFGCCSGGVWAQIWVHLRIRLFVDDISFHYPSFKSHQLISNLSIFSCRAMESPFSGLLEFSARRRSGHVAVIGDRAPGRTFNVRRKEKAGQTENVLGQKAANKSQRFDLLTRETRAARSFSNPLQPALRSSTIDQRGSKKKHTEQSMWNQVSIAINIFTVNNSDYGTRPS